MNLKLRGRKFRGLWLIGFSVLFLASVAFLWFISHRNNVQKSVLERIPPDADIGVVHLLSEVNNLRNTHKLLTIESEDSVKSFLSVLIKSDLRGVDLLIDPILFRYAGSTDFQLVLKLNNKKGFEHWLNNKPGKIWPYTIIKNENYSLCTFQNQSFSLIYDADYVVVVFDQKEAISIADKFFDPSNQFDTKRTLPKVKNANELVTFSIQTVKPIFIENKAIPVEKGIVRLILTENRLHIQSNEFTPQTVPANCAQWTINKQNVNIAWNKVIKDFWKVKADLNPILEGSWYVAWKGIKKQELVYLSYDFDDNFNRIEKKKVVEENLPDIDMRIRFDRLSQSDSLYNHLKKHGLIRKNEVQIGPFWYNVSRNDTVWVIDSEANMPHFMGNSIFLKVDVSVLKDDLETLSIPYQNLDSVLHNNLKTIDMQNNNGNFSLTIEVFKDCPFHILPIIARLNRVKFD